ncbi:MAG: flagellar filament capping protein FliD [Pseudomonadota bacterium]
MSISSLGVGSGIDLQGLLDQLVAAERGPTQQRLAIREAGLQAEFSAFGNLTAAVQSLRDAAEKLTELTPGKSAVVSGAIEALTASADETAALGSYTVQVDQLATQQSLATTAFASSDTLVGSGTITIAFGTTDYDSVGDVYNGFTADAGRTPVTIEIGPGDQSLSAVRDSINEANAGVTASIVTDVNGPRLVLSSNSSGAESTLEITVADNDGNNTDTSGLSALAFNAAATNLEQTVAGQDAAFSVNGLSLSAASNSGITAVEGLTLNLEAVSTTAAVIKVANRESDITSALNDFAEAYNGLVSLNGELASFDPESGQSGTLFGDTTLRGLINSLRTGLSVSGSFSGLGADSLLEMGLTTAEDGTLSVDNDAVQAFIGDDFNAALSRLTDVSDAYLKRTDPYINGDGLINVRTDGIQTRLDDIADERVALDRRIEAIEQRLTRQFANLDTLLSNLRTTSQFVTNQLSNLNINQSDS